MFPHIPQLPTVTGRRAIAPQESRIHEIQTTSGERPVNQIYSPGDALRLRTENDQLKKQCAQFEQNNRCLIHHRNLALKERANSQKHAQDALAVAERALRQQASKINDLEARLRESQSQAALVRGQLQSESKEAKAGTETREKVRADIPTAVNTAKVDNTTDQTVNSSQTEQIRKLQDELEKSRTKIESLKGELADSEKTRDEAENELRHLNFELEVMQTQLDQQQTALDDSQAILQETIEERTKVVNDLMGEVEALRLQLEWERGRDERVVGGLDGGFGNVQGAGNVGSSRDMVQGSRGTLDKGKAPAGEEDIDEIREQSGGGGPALWEGEVDQAFRMREERVSEREQDVEAREGKPDQAIRMREDRVGEREREVQAREDAVELREERVSESEKKVEAREGELDQAMRMREQRVSEREREVEAKEDAVKQKKEENIIFEQALAVRATQLSEINDDLRAQKRELQSALQDFSRAMGTPLHDRASPEANGCWVSGSDSLGGSGVVKRKRGAGLSSVVSKRDKAPTPEVDNSATSPKPRTKKRKTCRPPKAVTDSKALKGAGDDELLATPSQRVAAGESQKKTHYMYEDPSSEFREPISDSEAEDGHVSPRINMYNRSASSVPRERPGTSSGKTDLSEEEIPLRKSDKGKAPAVPRQRTPCDNGTGTKETKSKSTKKKSASSCILNTNNAKDSDMYDIAAEPAGPSYSISVKDSIPSPSVLLLTIDLTGAESRDYDTHFRTANNSEATWGLDPSRLDDVLGRIQRETIIIWLVGHRSEEALNDIENGNLKTAQWPWVLRSVVTSRKHSLNVPGEKTFQHLEGGYFLEIGLRVLSERRSAELPWFQQNFMCSQEDETLGMKVRNGLINREPQMLTPEEEDDLEKIWFADQGK